MLMRILFVCIVQIFSLSLFSFNRPVVLPRVIPASVEKEVRAYEQRKHQENVESLVKRGTLIGIGALGVVGLGVVGIYAQGMGKIKGDSAEEAKALKKENSHFEMFKKGMFWTVGGGLGFACFNLAKDLGARLLSRLWEKNDITVVHLFPLAKRIEYSLDRLACSMEELNKYSEGTFLFNHYYSEIEDAFTLLIRTLEKFCGILSYELKNIYGTDDASLQDATKSIEKLFFFSGQLALEIETDLNKADWAGFRKETFDMLEGFDLGCRSLLPRKQEAVK